MNTKNKYRFVTYLPTQAECDDEGDYDETVNEATATTESKTPIKAHHVTRIAGDLLMDFS